MNATSRVPVPLTVPMYVALGQSDKPAMGLTWRIWSSRTSFYMKFRAPGVGHLKLSLHGDDPRHSGGGGFKMAMSPERDGGTVWGEPVDVGEAGSIRGCNASSC